MSKKILSKFLLIFILVLSFCGKTYADHLGAMDIYVDWAGKYHGDLTYKVTLIVYRACAPNNLHFSNDNQQVSISSVSCNLSLPILTVDTIGNDTDQIVDQLCPSFHNINSCFDQSSPWPGFEKWTYTGYVTLPQRCSDWTFSFASCCRNLAVTNLVAGGIYVSTVINNTINDSVSSPRFFVDPIPYMCAGQPASFFNGPVDPDGDSIITINQIPLQGLNQPNTYNTGFNVDSPINSSTLYTVNPVTGVASFTPQTSGKYIIAFTVNKYDPGTGAFLASSERDVQVSILPCASPPPTIDSQAVNIVNGKLKEGDIIVTCINNALSFDINAKSQSATNTLYMSDDPGKITTSTFTVTGQGSATPKGTFAWTPLVTDLGPHVVVIIAVDSTCTAAQPIVFKAFTVVTIIVYPGIVANPHLFNTCSYISTPTTLNVSYYPGFTYQWTDIDGISTADIINPTSLNPIVQPPATTSYIITSPGWPTGCRNTDTVVVNVDNTTNVQIAPPGPPNAAIVFCQPGILPLTATPSGIQPYINLSCGLTDTTTGDHDSTAIVPIEGNYQYVTDSNVTPFNFLSSHNQYLVKAQDMKHSGMFSSSLTGLAFNVSYAGSAPSMIHELTISLKCTTQPLDTNGHLATGLTQVYYGTAIAVPGTGYLKIQFDTVYNWDTTQDLIVDVLKCDLSAFPGSFVNYYKTPYKATTQSFIRNASPLPDLCNAGVADSLVKPVFLLPDMMFFYDHAPLAPWQFDWIKAYGSNLLSDSTIQSPELYVSKSSKYYVYIRNRYQCLGRDSVYIFLDQHFATVNPIDTSICAGRFTPINVTGGTTWQWFENGFNPTFSLSCTDCEVPIAKPADTTKYIVVVSDSVGCSDTLSSVVNILPLPIFTVTPHDTTIKYGKHIQLIASNDSLNYVWTPIETINDPYASSPTVKPFEPTVYTVTGFLNNCSTSDTVRVDIDYRATLLMPSAFTPNNDGKDDRFRIAGITYQKVLEFRVFNRLGQEIFYATDNNGWDGTWNGAQQDIDTYFYYARVAYPDGVIETFKGDVTLIR